MAEIPDTLSGKTLSVTIDYLNNQEKSLYRLKKQNTLHVVVSENLLGKRIAILTNYPTDETIPFERSEYYI